MSRPDRSQVPGLAHPRMEDARRMPRRVATTHRSAVRMRHRWWWRTPHDGALVPVIATAVEGTAAVIAVPVRSYAERDNGYADTRAIHRQKHWLVLIFVFDVIAGDPAAVAVGDHVTPFPARGAALDIHLGARLQLVDQGIVDIGAGTQVDVAGHVPRCRLGQPRERHCQRGGNQPCEMFHRACLLWVGLGGRSCWSRVQRARIETVLGYHSGTVIIAAQVHLHGPYGGLS